MSQKMIQDIHKTLLELKDQGMYKSERMLTSAQGAAIRIERHAGETGQQRNATQQELAGQPEQPVAQHTIAGQSKQPTARQEPVGPQIRHPADTPSQRDRERTVLNFCANNYLGFSADPAIIEAAKSAMESWGYGLSSVRFICGTQSIHTQLEREMASFLSVDDAILYAACFDANGGLFEPLLGPEDAVISDELNHASIIDGVRLCKAKRFRYAHSDMTDLKRCLEESKGNRYRIICTDGVFSMDGDIANLPDIVRLAEAYDALIMVDDSHATGYIGTTGRGTPEYHSVEGNIDMITTTFGKALGGASGGCTAGRKEIIEMLRQRSRPYLFSNTLPPAVVGATLKALELLKSSSDRIGQLKENGRYFRKEMEKAGFDITRGDTAIVPVMLYDERKALEMSDRLLEEGIYVIGFTYPVVPKGKARIRVQLSAAHTKGDLDRAIAAFTKTGREMNVL